MAYFDSNPALEGHSHHQAVGQIVSRRNILCQWSTLNIDVLGDRQEWVGLRRLRPAQGSLAVPIGGC
jgi:hypothetical protein